MLNLCRQRILYYVHIIWLKPRTHTLSNTRLEGVVAVDVANHMGQIAAYKNLFYNRTVLFVFSFAIINLPTATAAQDITEAKAIRCWDSSISKPNTYIYVYRIVRYKCPLCPVYLALRLNNGWRVGVSLVCLGMSHALLVLCAHVLLTQQSMVFSRDVPLFWCCRVLFYCGRTDDMNVWNCCHLCGMPSRHPPTSISPLGEHSM